jgi:hypothetical protein
MRWIYLVSVLVAGFATSASALPIVSVDADTTLAGVDSSRTVMGGSTFSVDIVISGVDAGSPLNGFEFDLFFDPSVLTATSVVDGGFLLAPVFQVQNSVGVMSIEFAEVTLLPDGASGSGVLATIVFEAALAGNSALDLQNLLLAAPFGVPIETDGIADGSISIAGSNPIPEPSSGLLFALGFAVVGSSVSRANRLRFNPAP